MSAKVISYLTLAIFTISVECHDIRIGFATPQSRKIYSEIKEADPALWRRTDDIIINAPRNEIISAVYVTDLREDKNGEAQIESGGIGQKSVTIGIKSPSILRGYKFEIEVFGNDPSLGYSIKGGAQYNDDTQFARKF